MLCSLKAEILLRMVLVKVGACQKPIKVNCGYDIPNQYSVKVLICSIQVTNNYHANSSVLKRWLIFKRNCSDNP